MPSYRQLHEDQLRENRPELYRSLQRSGRLRSHLDSLQREASEQHALLVRQLAEKNPYNPADWKNDRAAWEGWLDRTARELVLRDVVLVPSPEDEKADRDGYID